MKRIKMTVGEAIVKFLDRQYVRLDGREEKFVEGVFTVFGHGCVLGMGEALAMTSHGLKVYQGKNEQGMAHAAIAYAKQNNRLKIMPCISSIGPGAANMITAAATATVNNIPLLLLPGDTFAVKLRGKKVKNPQTGVLIELPGKQVGTVTVTATAGDTPETEYSVVEVAAEEQIDTNRHPVHHGESVPDLPGLFGQSILHHCEFFFLNLLYFI